jgi:hypothetical protein
MSVRSLSLLALLALVPFRLALAQIPTVSASVTGYTAIGIGAIPESEWVPITVTRNDGVLHAEASGEGGRFFAIPGISFVGGTTGAGIVSAYAGGFASAQPGVLHVFGSDLAVARDPISPPGLPETTNGFTVYTNVQASAGFTDYLTVNDAGVAIGTEVQVPFRYLAEVVSNYPLGYPPFSEHPIGVYASFIIPGIGPQNFSTESGFFPFTRTTLASGNGLYVVQSSPFTVTAHVGDVLPISASFSISGQANITDFNRQLEFGGFADGRNTAGIWLGDLPIGMTITSASGHDYSVDPRLVTAVPEPESYALMLAGLACVGLVARCRQRRAERG